MTIEPWMADYLAAFVDEAETVPTRDLHALGAISDALTEHIDGKPRRVAGETGPETVISTWPEYDR